jgi:hypothetical protein
MNGTRCALAAVFFFLDGCAGGAGAPSSDGNAGSPPVGVDGADASPPSYAGNDDAAVADGSTSTACTTTDGGTGCYAIQCPGGVHTLTANRDRLVADLARRKCTDSCTLWAALNQAERYIFLMDTAYLGAPSSRLYPPGASLETALDHAVALYSINGPLAGQGVDGSGRGGNDYNRIYLGFDALAECVMRDFPAANPTKDPSFNQWQKSDDLAGPHAPFTQREMIYWYKALTDLQSNGPQFHHWHADGDFTQSGIDQRLGVCGNTDRSLTELTIAFDFFHNSDPLGDYAGRGGYGWQIVDQYVGIPADWSYTPTGCPATPPVNTDPYGGGTFAGMGPSQSNGACTTPTLSDGGTC